MSADSDDSGIVNVLHISDLHLTNRRAHDKEQDIILSALIEDMERLVIAGLKPDLIIFGGDLANDADESGIYYTAFEKLFEPVLQKTRLSGERLIISPGNHDARRTVVKANAAQHREFAGRTSVSDMNALYREDHYRSMQRDKFQTFKDIYELSESPGLDFGRGYSICELSDLGLVVANINTAITSAAGLPDVVGDDYGKLIYPEYAAIDLCKEMARYAGCFKILVSHHPFEWLNEESKRSIENMLVETFDIHFGGHIHLASPQALKSLGGSTVRVQTGALYQGRKKWNGYSLVRLDPTGGYQEIILKKYSPENRKFVAADLGEGGIFYPNEESRVFWKSRPSIDREKLAGWVGERLKPFFLEKHGETLVGKDISDVFYEHPMQARLNDFEVSSQDERAHDDPTMENILRGTENFVIFGDTNFGKTTLLKRLALELINSSSPESVAVPALFEFRDISSTGDAVFKAVRASVDGLPEIMNLRQLLGSGLITVMIDDVDPGDLSRMESLAQFMRDFPRCRYVFTSKVTQAVSLGLVANFGTIVGFREVVLQPLRSVGIRRFTAQYCGDPDQERCGKLSKRIIDVLHQNSLPPTAFTISVLLEVFGGLSGDALINQVTLIERFIEYLLAKDKIAEASRSTFDYDDKVDCLSFIAMRMARAGNYDLTYDELLQAIVDYIESVGFPHKATDVLETFLRQKIIRKTDVGIYRFYLRAFLEFFIASGMNKDSTFYDYVMDPERYLSFTNEIEFYCGLNRRDPEILETIATRHRAISAKFKSELDFKVELAAFDSLQLPGPAADTAAQALEDVREALATPALTQEEKDEAIDEQLFVNSTSQDAFRPKVDGLGTELHLSIILYSTTLRNLGHLGKEKKEQHFAEILDGWIEYLAHSYTIIQNIVKHRRIRLDGVEYRVFSKAVVSDERLARMLMLHMPTGMAALIRSYLGSEKMVRQVEFDAGGNLATIQKVMRSFLLADLEAEGWMATVNRLRPLLMSKRYLGSVVLWKMNAILKMKEMKKAEAERLIEVIARLYSEQLSGDPEEQGKNYTRELQKLQKMLSVREIRNKAEERETARFTLASAARNVTSTSV